MLMGSLAAFTLVAVMGLMMIKDVWQGYPIDPAYPRFHAGAALFGSALVITLAMDGDTRLYANIGLAVVIILLGLAMSLKARKGKRVPKSLLAAHAGLAVACYGLLAYFAFNPQAALF